MVLAERLAQSIGPEAAQAVTPAADYRGQEYIPKSRLRNVILLQPRSMGGNFENVFIHRQGLMVLSGALKQHEGPYVYDTSIWFEERSGKIDPDKDLEGVDVYCGTSLINETPRAYEIGRQAKEYHPDVKTIGGGPQIGQMWAEALEHGKFDVVVQGEGKDRIGEISDALLTLKGNALYMRLDEIGGLAYMRDGHPVLAPRRRGFVKPDYVRLLDFNAIRDLSPKNPMAAGVLETVRGCLGKCTYCGVRQQFPGYRRTSIETEMERILQIMELTDRGLIAKSPNDGRIAVFISDDLQVAPLRFKILRDERIRRAQVLRERFRERGINLGDQFFFISQNRPELGQDPEMVDTLLSIGNNMIYFGLESLNGDNLEAVDKMQDPQQARKYLLAIKAAGIKVIAMTMWGLPFHTRQNMREEAKQIREISDYQTANWLTPLPGTPNWPVNGNYSRQEGGMLLLNVKGELLNGSGYPRPGGELPPYELYTGEQFVHLDTFREPGWSMQESREILKEDILPIFRSVNRLYERLNRQAQRRAKDSGGAVPRHI